MFHGEATMPLTRRLISGYFLFCLAGLLLCVATAIVLGYRQSLTDNIVLLVLGPATVMTVGAYSIYQHIRVHAVIENELTQVCRTKDRDSLTVRPLEGVGPAVAGWNRLLERLSASESMEQLEDRLAKASSTTRKNVGSWMCSTPWGMAWSSPPVMASFNSPIGRLLRSSVRRRRKI